MADIPVILFHRSEQSYVTYALKAARSCNERVIIITDVSPSHYSDHAEIVPIQSLPGENARRFANIYIHRSSNRYEFEFHAIEKYFFLLDLMRSRQLEQIVYIDSDVMVYSNLTPVLNRLCAGADLAFAMPEQREEELYWTASGHISYWTRSAMEAFCTYILDTYEHNQSIFEPKWNWHREQHIPGGINDMTLIYLFQRQSALRSISLLQVFTDDQTFDNAIRWGSNEYPDEYQTDYSFLIGEPVKAIRFRNGFPYCRNRRLNKEIGFHILHFQGKAKNLMPLYLRGHRTITERLSSLIWAFRIFHYQKKPVSVLLGEYLRFRRKTLKSTDAKFRKQAD